MYRTRFIGFSLLTMSYFVAPQKNVLTTSRQTVEGIPRLNTSKRWKADYNGRRLYYESLCPMSI